MTLERDEVIFDMFGLAGTFPRPGWVVLDAARSHGFTGELTFDTIPSVKVYLDGGLIYLAERVTDPSLGSRLVDAGALNAAQLEHGSMMVGEIAHLGRLFERVPSVNRHTVMVMTEMMTEECVGWMAGQLVREVEAAPYRHHPAGVQRWLHPAGVPTLVPGEPLPSPAIDEAPVELVPPEPMFAPGGLFDDGLITWDQPSWLDDQRSTSPPIDLLSNEVPQSDDVTEEVEPTAPETPPVEQFPSPPSFSTRDVPEQFVALGAPSPDVALPAPVLATPDLTKLAARVPAGDPNVAAVPAPPLVAPVVAEPTEATSGVAAAAGASDASQPAAMSMTISMTISDDWADLVAAVTQPDEPDVDPVVPAVETTDVRPDWPPVSPSAAGDWADLAAAVLAPVAQPDRLDSVDSDFEPLPVRQRPAGDLSEPPPAPAAVAEPPLPPPPERSQSFVPTMQSPQPAASTTHLSPSSVLDDWVDNLDAVGLPEPGSEVLMTTKRLAPNPAAVDRFEVIWPSGEVDEQFGSSDTASIAERHPDLDRSGPTARLASPSGAMRATGAPTLEHDVARPEQQPESDQPINGHDEVTDEVVLAVRRAVASIETDSLEARRRLVTPELVDDPSRGVSDRGIRSLRPISATSDALTPGATSARRVPTRSVFDDDLPSDMPEPAQPQTSVAPVVEPQAERVGALRRLIGSLRRR